MRLRLTVKRNGIPDTAVIWAIDTTSSPTVYRLLEQVNEIIPITTDDEWDLDDYAVEVKGSNGANYECLHFQSIDSVMKDEDEIIIRPLLTHDLKSRSVSGRHQISTDGRHLIDGVPFGKPLLKRPRGRPAVNIHSRKRPKLLEDDEAEEEANETKALEDTPADEVEQNASRQMVLHGDLDFEDSEDDEDFAPEEDEDEDSEEDSENEEDSSVDAEGDTSPVEAGNEDTEKAEALERPIADITDPAIRAQIRMLHSAFPDSDLALCRYILQGAKYDMAGSFEAMCLQFQPTLPNNAITKTSEGEAQIPSSSQLEAPEDEDDEDEDSQGDDEDSVVKYYDQNGLPPGSIKSGKALSFMAAAVNGSPVRPLPESRGSVSGVSNKNVKFADVALSHGFTSTPAIDKESQEVDSSSGDSDSSSSEEEEDHVITKADRKTSSDEDDDASDSSSDDSSDSSSDESSDEQSDIEIKDDSTTKQTRANAKEESSSSDSDSDSSSDDSSSDDEAPEVSSSRLDTSATESKPSNTANSVPGGSQKMTSSESQVTPGEGSPATQKRNQRRRTINNFQRYQKKGVLPAGTTVDEFKQLELTSKTSPEEAIPKLEELRKKEKKEQVEKFEQKRKWLLESLASGGVDVEPKDLERLSRSVSAQPSQKEADAAIDLPMEEVPDSQPIPHTLTSAYETLGEIGSSKPVPNVNMEVDEARPSTASETSTHDTPLTSPKPAPASAGPSKDATKIRRSRLDLGAGKRMLFGALGIKAPKTKADEEKVKSDLMKFARPLKVVKAVEEDQNPTDPYVDEDPDAWRQNINYRAVECVQEGVVLSEPPFPFVQRWDPQQQYKGGRGGKRKQFQRDQPQYQDDTRASKKQKQRKGKHTYAKGQEYLEASYEPSYQEETELQYEDSTQIEKSPAGDFQGEVSQQLVNENQTPPDSTSQGPGDLAPLPQDVSSLPVLKDGEAKIGMTIAFKIMELGESGPQISPCRTAIVIGFEDDGSLQLSLAMRDRQKPEKKYDESGERVYGRFEVADDSDEEAEDENEGMLYKAFYELYEPKILQQPPDDLVTSEETPPNNILGDNSQDKPSERSEGSKTLSHEEEAPEAQQFSHVTETPLNSDAPDSQQPDKVAEDMPMVDSAPEPVEDESMEGIPEATTPKAAIVEATVFKPATPVRQVSDEDRREISTIIREVGFRSSIPSSVLRDIRPDSMQSPADATAFENLRKEMLQTPAAANAPYSPKFHGFGSSPPPQATQDTWETVDSEYGTPSPEVLQDEPDVPEQSSGWVTEGQQGYSSSPPAKKPSVEPSPARQASASPLGPEQDAPAHSNEAALSVPAQPIEVMPKPDSLPDPEVEALVRKAKHAKELPKHVHIDGAQELWETFQPAVRRVSTDSSSSGKATPSLWVDGPAEKESGTSVQYPKLSGASSFTSQITDHGRQPEPELAYDESTMLSGNTNLDLTDVDVDGPSIILDCSEFCGSRSVSKPNVNSTDNADNGFVDVDENIQHSEPSKKASTDDSSDDEFPSLEALSQQRTIRHEASQPDILRTLSKNLERKTSIPAADGNMSDGSNQSTPKASGGGLKALKSLFSRSKGQASIKRESSSQSQSRGSEPRGFQPPATQVVDLTISSDADDDDASPINPTAFKPTTFKKYDLGEDSDDDETGWTQKKKSTIPGVEARRHTGGGGAGSKGALNGNRRKTVAR